MAWVYIDRIMQKKITHFRRFGVKEPTPFRKPFRAEISLHTSIVARGLINSWHFLFFRVGDWVEVSISFQARAGEDVYTPTLLLSEAPGAARRFFTSHLSANLILSKNRRCNPIGQCRVLSKSVKRMKKRCLLENH